MPTPLGDSTVLFLNSAVSFCRQAEDNPFALPSDEQIFMLQEVERQQRTQLMQSMRSLPVHKKSTFSSQIQATVIRDTGLEPPTRKSEPKKRYAKPCAITRSILSCLPLCTYAAATFNALHTLVCVAPHCMLYQAHLLACNNPRCIPGCVSSCFLACDIAKCSYVDSVILASQRRLIAAAQPAAPPSNRRPKEQENMNDFIAKKREIFLVQMSLDTKRAEITKLEERALQVTSASEG